MRPISELYGLYPGQTCWVVGRGPSLGRLRAKHFGQGPVIAINQAIEMVEELGIDNPVYSMQKDVFFFKPKRAPILAHTWESYKISQAQLDRLNAYVFDNVVDFSIPWNMPSVTSCMGLAKRMGCVMVIYLCCDAATDGITEAYGEPAVDPKGYLAHKRVLFHYAHLAHMPVEYRRI
jgi:hypothetical protein